MSISSDLKRAAEGAVNAGDHWGRRDSFERQLAKLATPETILVLTAENERLAACLKTANEQAERFERNWYFRGDEIDQLRAEVAGLKTGYEAYERVNAELKADNEALVSAMNEILQVTPMGVAAFGVAALVLGELSGAAAGKGEQS